MLYRVGGVRDHARVNHGALRQRVVLPHAPLMRVARRSGLEGETADLGTQDFLDDIRKRHVGNVRAVPGAPADMQARLFLGQAGDGIIEHIDALANKTAEVLHGRLGIDLVPSLGQVGRVELHSKPSIGDGLVFGAHGAADVGKQLMLIVVVAVGQARGRAGRKGGDEARGAGWEASASKRTSAATSSWPM